MEQMILENEKPQKRQEGGCFGWIVVITSAYCFGILIGMVYYKIIPTYRQPIRLTNLK